VNAICICQITPKAIIAPCCLHLTSLSFFSERDYS